MECVDEEAVDDQPHPQAEQRHRRDPKRRLPANNVSTRENERREEEENDECQPENSFLPECPQIRLVSSDPDGVEILAGANPEEMRACQFGSSRLVLGSDLCRRPATGLGRERSSASR